MKLQQGEVYLVNFPQKGGNEFYGKHYAIVLTHPDKSDGTSLTDKDGKQLFEKIYKPAYTLDETDHQKLIEKIKEVLDLNK